MEFTLEKNYEVMDLNKSFYVYRMKARNSLFVLFGGLEKGRLVRLGEGSIT